MSASPAVRPATSTDVAFVREACRSYLPEPTLVEQIGGGDVLIAEIGGDPVGYAALDRIGAVSPLLAAIHVLEPHRRGGIGRALLAALEQLCASRGHDVLYSSSTADETAPQAWHRRMGFEECGFVAGFNTGGVGEVIFRKPLRPGPGVRAT